jgi:hypothetical protein
MANFSRGHDDKLTDQPSDFGDTYHGFQTFLHLKPFKPP